MIIKGVKVSKLATALFIFAGINYYIGINGSLINMLMAGLTFAGCVSDILLTAITDSYAQVSETQNKLIESQRVVIATYKAQVEHYEHQESTANPVV